MYMWWKEIGEKSLVPWNSRNTYTHTHTHSIYTLTFLILTLSYCLLLALSCPLVSDKIFTFYFYGILPLFLTGK